MPSVYHWGGRSLDEAKISQAEQARAGEAICRPSDRSATPAAVQVATAGVALRSLGLQMASPALACSAWLIFASSSDRPPQWYTLGIGLALLAVVAVWRRDPSTHPGHDSPEGHQ